MPRFADVFVFPKLILRLRDKAEETKELPVVSVTAERMGNFKSDLVQVGAFL